MAKAPQCCRSRQVQCVISWSACEMYGLCRCDRYKATRDVTTLIVPAGMRVQVAGLSSARGRALNGREGRVQDKQVTPGRVAVLLDGDAKPNSIRLTYLRPLAGDVGSNIAFKQGPIPTGSSCPFCSHACV